jgi:hypothetical protein
MSVARSSALVGAPSGPEEPRRSIAVLGAQREGAGVLALLGAIESTIPVRFVRLGRIDPASLAGVLALDPQATHTAPRGLPTLTLAASPAAPASAASSGAPTRVCFGEDPQLARPLRGRAIGERSLPAELPTPPGEHPRVLADVTGRPVWMSFQSFGVPCFASAYPLAQLGEAETLREHFEPGCFMGLLPLVHFIGAVLGAESWALPPPRAAFVVDDPNLHSLSYGFLRYRELPSHASRHGYHLALATVPLDGWHVDRRAAALIRQNAGSLSLAIHGNDHLAGELGRLTDDRQAEAAIAQAMRRVHCQERRAGLRIDRVMVPPHSACSQASLRAMFRLGLDGVCINRPYPWRDGMPGPMPLAGWHPAELVAGGTAVRPRRRLDEDREELIFRALLGQPLVLYGHHADFAAGLQALEQAAAEVHALAGAHWGSLRQVAEAGCSTRRLGERMLVRVHARKSSVKVPAGVRSVEVQIPAPYGGPAWHRLAHQCGVAEVDFKDGWGLTAPIPCEQGARLDLMLMPDAPLSPAAIPAARTRAWPLMRRLATETRDRALPLARAARPPKAFRPPGRSVAR